MAKVKNIFEVRYSDGNKKFYEAQSAQAVRAFVKETYEGEATFTVRNRTQFEAKEAYKAYKAMVDNKAKVIFPNSFGTSKDAKVRKEQERFNELVDTIRSWSVDKEVQWKEAYLVVVFEMGDGRRYEYVENRKYGLPYSLTQV